MTYLIRLKEEPFEFESNFATEMIGTEWESEVDRSSRDYIKWVQQSLNQILGLRLTVDGNLGPQTRNAIRSFQKQNGLTADGMVGPSTQVALKTALGGRPDTTRIPMSQRPMGQRPRFVGRRTLGLRFKPQIAQQSQAPDEPETDLVNCSNPVIFDRFELSDYRLRPHHYELLLRVAETIAPLAGTDAALTIDGHTDTSGDERMNVGLSLRRAFEVRQYLQDVLGGVVPIEIRIRGFGETQPIPGAAATRNRRVEIRLCSQPAPPPPIIQAQRNGRSRSRS